MRIHRGNRILGVGIVIFSMTMLTSHIIHIPEPAFVFFEGIGAVLEILGVIMLFREKRVSAMPNSGVYIKQLGPSDLPLAAEVIRKSFATVAKELDLTEENCPRHPAFITTIERLQGFFNEGKSMYGFYEDGRLVGYTALSKKEDGVYGIHNLAILPEVRHKGYGKRLLDFCKETVKESGGRKIAIDIIEDNAVLKEWYLANGFRHTGTTRIERLPFTIGSMEWECN